jgi:hypothetical protein
MALNVGLDVSFDNMDWKGIREKAGEVNKQYGSLYEDIRNYGTSS